jgi:hypothetical protein
MQSEMIKEEYAPIYAPKPRKYMSGHTRNHILDASGVYIIRK